jgi:hypothetical protein
MLQAVNASKTQPIIMLCKIEMTLLRFANCCIVVNAGDYPLLLSRICFQGYMPCCFLCRSLIACFLSPLELYA